MGDCHCGAKTAFENCCQPIHENVARATSPEALMRAHYSAYVLAEIDFLHDSLHPNGREEFDFDATKAWAESSSWESLEILDNKAGGPADKTGTVDFVATFTDADGKRHRHCERSQFKRVNNIWLFCDGQTIAPNKVGRNDPCTCGSGKKYKKCCGA